MRKGNYFAATLMKAFLFILFFPFTSFTQDLAGVWKGTMHTTGSSMTYEVVINEEKGKLSGYSMTIFTIDGVDNTGVKSIKLKSKGNNLLLEDGELIYHNYSTTPKRIKLTGNLNLHTERGEMVLSGTFTTRSLDMRDNTSYNGLIRLQKTKPGALSNLTARLALINLEKDVAVTTPKAKEKELPTNVVAKNQGNAKPKKKEKEVQPAIVKNKEVVEKEVPPAIVKSKEVIEAEKELSVIRQSTSEVSAVDRKKTNALPPSTTKATARIDIPEDATAKLASREIETIQRVSFRSDSLVISLYDNGQVDGDTVSVILNNKIIIAKKQLTENAITSTIYISPEMGDTLQLVLFAENLGTIPPNTGLLTVRDGNERYEIRFAGDLQKNAAIILLRKK